MGRVWCKLDVAYKEKFTETNSLVTSIAKVQGGVITDKIVRVKGSQEGSNGLLIHESEGKA